MAARRDAAAAPRPPLSREKVLAIAIAIADAGGLPAVTMRKVAERLGVEAMSLYHHVAGKEAILDGMVDAVYGEIELPSRVVARGAGWKAALRERAISTRQALVRHPWANGLMESRTNPGPETLRHHDDVLGVLRAAGFPVPLAAQALTLLDSYTYGFALQEFALPFGTPDEVSEVTGSIMEGFPADAYPHLTEMAVEHILKPGYDFGSQFEFGLDLILDGLERRRDGG